MTYNYISQPSSELITLEFAKNYLKIDSSNDLEDELLSAVIKSARSKIETFLNCTLLSRQLVVVYESFLEYFYLPVLPVIEVLKVEFIIDGVFTLLSPDEYKFQKSFSRIKIIAFPTDADEDSEVQITYNSGHQEVGDVPEDISLAMLLEIEEGFNNRQNGVRTLKSTSVALLEAHRNTYYV